MKTQKDLMDTLDRTIKIVRDSGQEPECIQLGTEEIAIIGSEFIHPILIMQNGKKVQSAGLYYDLIPVEEPTKKTYLMVICGMPPNW
jgi:hypothetical protein